MRELSNFLIENTVEFKPLMSNVPVPLIKKWVKEYKESGTKKEFEDWVDEHAWMLVDAEYSKVKNYSIFLLDPKDSSSIFGTQEQIGEEINSEFVVNYFDPIFKSIFLFPDGKYNEKALKEWAKSYNSLWRRREFYANLIANREKFEEPEFTTMFRILFIQSLGVEILNYFDLTDTMPMSLEDAEFMILGFVDCSDPKINLSEKWKYLEKHGKFLNAEIYKRALNQMMRTGIYSDQRRVVTQLCSMKNKKLKLSVIQEKLCKENLHLFCSCWQKVAGV